MYPKHSARHTDRCDTSASYECKPLSTTLTTTRITYDYTTDYSTDFIWLDLYCSGFNPYLSIDYQVLRSAEIA